MHKFNKALCFMILKQSYPRVLLKISNKKLRWLVKFLMSPYALIIALHSIFSQKIIMEGFELQITERCNLRCKDCSILIPYVKNPRHKEIDEILDDLKALLLLVDKIPNLKLIGGEVILHPKLDELLIWFTEEPKIGCITLVTNGTILFPEKIIPVLQNKKIYVLISNYGSIARRQKELIEQLKNNDVNYTIVPFENWLDFGNGDFRNYSEAQLIEIYKNCFIKYSCTHLHDKKLFPCARAESLYTMGIDNSENTYGFLDISGIRSKSEMRKKLREFYALPHISACNYCSMGTPAMKPIPAAVQLQARDRE